MITRADYVNFPELMVDFLNYNDAIKNRSKHTISEYASDLRTFFRFMKAYKGLVAFDLDNFDKEKFREITIMDINDKFVKKITITDVYAFLVFCKDTLNNSAKTRARKVVTLRTFFKYCTVQKRLFTLNPMQELDSPRFRTTLPKYLTLDQAKDLLRAAAEGPCPERDFAIITLFLNCGMRLSELVSINISDIRNDETIRIVGKGDKERTIYLNNACISAINSYMRVRPVDGVEAKHKDALFLSARNQRISPKTVQYLVKQALERAGLDGFSVHKLRHTAATLMYQHGNADVLVLKEILGHENIGTTQIYTHIGSDQLKKATDSNPLNQPNVLDK
ncbi:MAG: tyrosine recombinase XerC [Ruminococcaceae bacterium]|nr:tyrosine recombinase XerC [Oscillospiraceae bacterium]